MKRTLLFVAACLPVAGAAQQVPQHFDVISVKPHAANDSSMLSRWTSDSYEVTNESLRVLISSSYGVPLPLISGLPAWAESAHWDLAAKVTETDHRPLEALSKIERDRLLASALHDRFGLQVHAERKVLPVFFLSVAPGGPKVQRSAPAPGDEAEPTFGRSSFTMNNGVGRAEYFTMNSLAELLSQMLGRRVVDQTGLSGEYDFTVRIQQDEQAGADDVSPSGLIQAVNQQLGLKLASGKAPVPMLVVDRIVQPDAN